MLKRYILHADQTVGVRGSWGYETLRSKTTFAIDAHSEAEALKIAEKQVRERYTQPSQKVEHVMAELRRHPSVMRVARN